MSPIRIWLPFLSILILACGSIIAIGMGWQNDYLEMRRRVSLSAETHAERARHVEILNQTLASTELPRVSSALHTLRTQQAVRQNILAKLDGLALRFPDQDAFTAARRTLKAELAYLTKYQQELENQCWELAAARISWRENIDMLVFNDTLINQED